VKIIHDWQQKHNLRVLFIQWYASLESENTNRLTGILVIKNQSDDFAAISILLTPAINTRSVIGVVFYFLNPCR